jgi:hypothetical protein
MTFPREPSNMMADSNSKANIEMDSSLNSSMEQTIKRNDLVELERLLRQTPALTFIVELATCRLEKRPTSMKRKKAVNLLLTHGWDVNGPIGVQKDPMLR